MTTDIVFFRFVFTVYQTWRIFKSVLIPTFFLPNTAESILVFTDSATLPLRFNSLFRASKIIVKTSAIDGVLFSLSSVCK